VAREAYNHQEIEAAVQKKWAELGIGQTNVEDDSKPPYYLLFEFPYPSGDLHIGHWFAFAVTDIFARLKRMQGNNVLFPIGFDSFGLPAENAAIKNGADPKEWTYANIERMRGQIRSMGTSLDWSKELVTSDPSYYKWTQWLFTKLYEQKLAERRAAPVKWCPKDRTVLANEQVIDGKCERCDTPVEEKVLTQWFFKITEYAKRLLSDLDPLPWREDIKDAQRAWIGESEGAKIPFLLDFKRNPADNDNRGPNGERAALTVFTTRPDTIFGATYLVIAPEHLWVTLATDDAHDVLDNKEEVRAYLAATKKKTERERSENKEKTGVELKGIKAINPGTQEEIPVYVADYVLGSYGTGAVMAVPAHDERDFEFAKKMHLPVRQVIEPIFIKKAGTDAVKAELPLVERRAVVAVVKHPTEEKYLALAWKKNDWQGFVVGGIDGDEEISETALREVREETGYKNARFVRAIGGKVHSQFFHQVKNENRFAHFDAVYLELADLDRDEMADEEKALHDVVWVEKEKVAEFVAGDEDMAHIWKTFQNNDLYTGDGLLVNSGAFDGRNNRDAFSDIIAAVGAEKTTNFRIRDWLVSRQRYWGCPIPVVYDPEGLPHPIPAEHLPWLLPTDVDFSPSDEAPLASSKELKERVTRIFGAGWTPEYDTLDTFVDSSWYFLRYLAPNDDTQFSNASVMKKWLPVNRYSGGSEHTTMHLLYARFFHKALYDLALVPTPEPFGERYNRGIILGSDGQKMSKRWGNVVNPDEMVAKYGSDAVRLYLAFIGPYNEPGHYPWNLDGVSSMRRFMDRVRTISKNITDASLPEALEASLARAIQKVGADAERFKFNTALSALMILLKEFESAESVPRDAFRSFLLLSAPFMPHLAEHLWEGAGFEGSVHEATWPAFRPELLEQETATVIVQLKGKKKGEISISREATEEEALKAAKEIESIAAAFADGTVSKVVYVPGRILNIVPG
jgi:leucyl-tRNA synthetase